MRLIQGKDAIIDDGYDMPATVQQLILALQDSQPSSHIHPLSEKSEAIRLIRNVI